MGAKCRAVLHRGLVGAGVSCRLAVKALFLLLGFRSDATILCKGNQKTLYDSKNTFLSSL